MPDYFVNFLGLKLCAYVSFKTAIVIRKEFDFKEIYGTLSVTLYNSVQKHDYEKFLIYILIIMEHSSWGPLELRHCPEYDLVYSFTIILSNFCSAVHGEKLYFTIDIIYQII